MAGIPVDYLDGVPFFMPFFVWENLLRFKLTHFILSCIIKGVRYKG